MMTSIDLKKTYAGHYSAKATPTIVEVPSRPFLMIDGAGDPNTSAEYVDAIESLYPLADGLRAAVKAATGNADVVMPLEGLWWADDMSEFDPADKSNWLWTAMICLPDAVTTSMADEVLRTVTTNKNLRAGWSAGTTRSTFPIRARRRQTSFAPSSANPSTMTDNRSEAVSEQVHERLLSGDL